MTSTKPASLLFALTAITGCSTDDDTAFEPPGATAHGATPAEWAARWWQWALAIPADQNPILDGPCTTGQSGDVFFLAGNFGGSSTRDCTVPAGKALFFPVADFLCWPSPELPEEGCATPATEAALTACAHGGFDGAEVTMSVTVDGEELDDVEAYRATSAQFSWTTPADEADQLIPGTGPIPANACGIPEGDRFGVTDGFWIMLRPLEAGTHTVHFAATIQPDGADPFELDLTYDITQE